MRCLNRSFPLLTCFGHHDSSPGWLCRQQCFASPALIAGIGNPFICRPSSVVHLRFRLLCSTKRSCLRDRVGDLSVEQSFVDATLDGAVIKGLRAGKMSSVSICDCVQLKRKSLHLSRRSSSDDDGGQSSLVSPAFHFARRTSHAWIVSGVSPLLSSPGCGVSRGTPGRDGSEMKRERPPHASISPRASFLSGVVRLAFMLLMDSGVTRSSSSPSSYPSVCRSLEDGPALYLMLV